MEEWPFELAPAIRARTSLLARVQRPSPRGRQERRDKRATVPSALREWQEEKELACIRDAEALALLPAEDREALERLWEDVAALLGGRIEPRRPARFTLSIEGGQLFDPRAM